MDVVNSGRPADGRILIVGVDDVTLPEPMFPKGSELVLQAQGPDRWVLIAAEPRDWVAFGADAVRKIPPGTVSFQTLPKARQLRDFVRGWRLGGYRFGGTSDDKRLVLPPGAPDVSEVVAQTAATVAARDLVNTPSNVKNPAWMIRRARSIARSCGADFQVISGRALQREGFGGVLAVGSGSDSAPHVAVLRRRGRGARIVLVGKGITFDSGGLSLKPRDSMALMKTDMAGAAAVLEAFTLAPAGIDIAAIVGLAENAFGADSYRPGDVITHVDATTTEVRNTDAEGRLVLADLLAYARRDLKADVIVDVATLTGAATLALSREMGALYATSPRLAGALVAAGEAVEEHLWEMPLVQAYRASLDSQIADRCHISTDPTDKAGSITAALFLQYFVGDVPWAHLDIAGPARSTAVSGPKTVGGTGFGAALLAQWLNDGARF